MGPETIIGQLRSDTTKNYIDNKINKEKKPWPRCLGRIIQHTRRLTVMEKDIGTEIVCDLKMEIHNAMSGAEWYKVIYEFNSGWALSPNGTIYLGTTLQSSCSRIIERWYAERKVMQGKP